MGNLTQYNIDWNKDFKTSDFKPLPSGLYAAKVTKSEIKETKAKDGKYITFKVSLLGAKGIRNRIIFPIHMIASDTKSVDFGLRMLKQLASILGLDYDDIQDTSLFHDKVFGVKLGVEDSEKYGTNNVIKEYVEYDESLLESSDLDENVFAS